jgi:hypothetical protein
MIEQFFMWWLNDHYILSTIFTPFLTLIWCIFTDNFLFRGLIALILYVVSAGHSHS